VRGEHGEHQTAGEPGHGHRPAQRASADRRAATARRLETMTYEEALKGTVLIGSPGSVAERLEELREELGLDGVLMELNCGGRIPHPNVTTALRLLCQEVMPRFH